MSEFKEKRKFLFRIISSQWKNILFVSLLEILTIVCSVAIPFLLGEMISSLSNLNSQTIRYLIEKFIIVTLLYLIWDGCNIFISIKFSVINKQVENNMRSFCYDRIFNSTMKCMESHSEGEIINRLLRDTEKLEKAFYNLFYMVISLIHVAALLFTMITIDKVVTLCISIFFIILILLQRIFSTKMKKQFSQFKNSEEQLLKDLKNYISGFMGIKILNLQNKCLDILDKRNKVNLYNYKNLNKNTSIYSNISFFVISLFRGASILIGSIIFVIKGTITIGEIFTMYSYAIQLTTQLKSIIEMNIVIKDMEISLDRVLSFLQEFEIENKEVYCNFEIFNITGDNVKFKYKETEIFKGITFQANRNDIIALKGKNGSGKTTFVKLLCGFYPVNNLYFNQVEQCNISEKQLLERISYIPQNVYLFPDTIMNNISCFARYTADDVYKICTDLGIHEKILSLENGYDTMVNEKNLNLSGGEKQLIALARGLLKDCDVLILDEINSALDAEVESVIIERIEEYCKDKIVFIISHKDKILSICNKFINIDEYK